MGLQGARDARLAARLAALPHLDARWQKWYSLDMPEAAGTLLSNEAAVRCLVEQQREATEEAVREEARLQEQRAAAASIVTVDEVCNPLLLLGNHCVHGRACQSRCVLSMQAEGFLEGVLAVHRSKLDLDSSCLTGAPRVMSFVMDQEGRASMVRCACKAWPHIRRCMARGRAMLRTGHACGAVDAHQGALQRHNTRGGQ